MLAFLRGSNPSRRATATQNPIHYEDGASWQSFALDTPWPITHCVPSRKSMFNPPLHLHLYQTEDFRVRAGTGVWHQPTAAATSQRTTVVRAGEQIHLPAGTFHRFENPSETEPLVVEFRVDPAYRRGEEERFFRNFFGYLEDCRRERLQPSLFQLQLFLYTMDGPLAVPVPGPDWLKWWVSRAFMVVCRIWVGEWLLGYKRTYKEYYVEKKED